MNCCHADFALVEGSDRGFTVGMPTFTFGAGVLREAGPQAQELGLKRVAIFTDKYVGAGNPFATVRSSLAAANVDVVVFDEISIEPTDASFQAASRFARDANVDGYVSVGGGSVMDTCKAANLYASHPADFMTYVNAPIGAGQRVPGPVKPHIACPTTSGTGSETTGIAIFNLQSMNAKTGHHFAPSHSHRSADRSGRHENAAGQDGRRHRLRLHESCARSDHRARVSSPPESRAGRQPAGIAGSQSLFRPSRRRGIDARRKVPAARGRRRVGFRGAH